MNTEDRVSNYDKFPTIKVNDSKSYFGYDSIGKEIDQQDKKTIVVDCYPRVDYEIVLGHLEKSLKPDHIIISDDVFYDGDKITELTKALLTDDRVRGSMYYGFLEDFIDTNRLEEMKKRVKKIQESNEKILVFGVGASLITKGEVLVYADLARWEIQLRYRKGMPNFKQKNNDEEILKKYKRGFFLEWRISDKNKRKLFGVADYWLDTNDSDNPVMISGETFNKALDTAANRPFRVVPYFDPGVWGGQWMKEVCDLDREEENFAWSFDGVPEENSLLFDIDGNIVEFPAMNLTLGRPLELLGESVYARFGAEFPIRFDLLDTMGGQNLSLQVHPTTDFIKNNYGMPYTQEESYYLLDAEENAKIYIGVRDDVNPTKMIDDLEKAARGEISFPEKEHINIVTTKKHDHFLIPPGTVHCSGGGTMVLEISASAYIFTFKLWDWDRLGLDGVPRPIHLEEGRQVINYNINETFAKNELINIFEPLETTPDYFTEKTGLHDLEFIQTNRHTFSGEITIQTDNNVRMLNLVEGEEIVIESKTDEFEPFVVHYAETFIVPANVKEYTMKPYGLSENKEVKVLEAFVKKD